MGQIIQFTLNGRFDFNHINFDKDFQSDFGSYFRRIRIMNAVIEFLSFHMGLCPYALIYRDARPAPIRLAAPA